MFGKENYSFGKADKTAMKIQKLRNKTRINKAKAEMRQARKAASKVKFKERLESSNPIVRKLAQGRESSIKKHEVKLRKMESEAKTAELDPKLQAAKAKADNAIKVEKAKYKSKTASSTALAAGMASLGRGLSDENNQDDAANRASQEKIIRTIFQPDNESGPEDSGNTGLTEGVE